MKVIKPGHVYKLDSFEGSEPQTLCFIEKVPRNKKEKPTIEELEKILEHKGEIPYEILPNGELKSKLPDDLLDTELMTINDGTTNEEVINTLVDRINYLQEKFPCEENLTAISGLQIAHMALKSRTEKRKSQGVEGKQLAHES